MKLRVVLRPLVPLDLIEIISYLSDKDPTLGQRFYQSLRSTLDRLSAFPGVGSPKRFRSKHLAGVRSWPVREFGDYLIFYRATSDAVIVLGVLHGKRNLPKVLRGRK